MSLAGKIHPIVTRGSRVSRAPPHHTLPAFLNLNGSETRISSLIRYECLEKVSEMK